MANVGIMPLVGDEARDLSAWHDAIDIMLTGVFHTLDVTVPVLRSQGRGGSIVITSLYLVSESGRYVTGTTLPVDAGVKLV